MEKIYRGPELLADGPQNVPIGVYMYDKLNEYKQYDALACPVTDKKASYGEVVNQSLQMAAVFRELGVQVEDAVAIVSENTMEFMPVVLGTFFAGAATAPINPTYVDRELEHCLLISTPKIVVASPLVAPKVVPVVQKLVQSGKLDKRAITLITGSGPGKNLLELAANVKNTTGLPVNVNNSMDKTSFIMCSSGTTGLPKGVELTNANILACFATLRDPRMISAGVNDVFTALLPFFHMYGLTMALLALSYGSKLVTIAKFQEEQFLATLQKYKVTISFLVPPIVVFLGKHPLVLKYDLSSWREIWCGAAPLSGEMQEAVAKRLGKNLVRQGYGLTETTLAVTMNPLNDNKTGSSGKVVPGMMCKVIDQETGKTLAAGQTGELCFHGPLIMKGYRNNPKATDATIDSAGWLHTGDIGYFDEEENVYIVDRVKELIKYKGYQVAPAELEAILLTHKGIQDAAVIGVPDERAGELPLAFVVLRPGTKLTEQEVKKFIADKVSPTKRLHGGVKFVTSIPKTASGKILRRDLREQLKMKSKL